MTLDIRVDNDDPASSRVLTVLGEIDMATVTALEQAVAAVDCPHGVVLDLSSTGFMDSSGVRQLIHLHDRFTADGRPFRLVVSGGPVARVLEVTDLLSYLDVYGSVPEALAG